MSWGTWFARLWSRVCSANCGAKNTAVVGSSAACTYDRGCWLAMSLDVASLPHCCSWAIVFQPLLLVSRFDVTDKKQCGRTDLRLISSLCQRLVSMTAHPVGVCHAVCVKVWRYLSMIQGEPHQWGCYGCLCSTKLGLKDLCVGQNLPNLYCPITSLKCRGSSVCLQATELL